MSACDNKDAHPCQKREPKHRPPPLQIEPLTPLCVNSKQRDREERMRWHFVSPKTESALPLFARNPIVGVSPNTSERRAPHPARRMTVASWPWLHIDLDGVVLPQKGDPAVEKIAQQLPPSAAAVYRALGKEGYKRFVQAVYAQPPCVQSAHQEGHAMLISV